MNFNFSENQKFITETISEFSKREIQPNFMDWDENQHFPLNLFKKLGELGMLGVLVPSKYGGSGLGYNEYVTVISEIAKVCASIGLSVAAHNSLCVGHILKFGTEEQKTKWLPSSFSFLLLSVLEWRDAPENVKKTQFIVGSIPFLLTTQR